MQVWSDAYIKLEVDPPRHLVRHTRTSRTYETIGVLKTSFDALNTQMAAIERAEYCLLQDLREARGRNDQQFEDAMRYERKRMCGGFRRVAMLVATQVGRLQIDRHLQHVDKLPGRAFLDEDEALRWLKEKT